jgi:hypothetical protein
MSAGVWGRSPREKLPPLFLKSERIAISQYSKHNYCMRDPGWNGDERLARLGYCAAPPLQGGLTAIGTFVPLIINEQAHSLLDQLWQRPIIEVVEGFGAYDAFLLDLADEARMLMDALPRTT